MKQSFTVTGMTCSACSAHVDKAARKVEGVTDVTVNLLGNSMVVEHAPGTPPEAVIAAVTAAGYGASVAAPASCAPKMQLARRPPPRLLAWAKNRPRFCGHRPLSMGEHLRPGEFPAQKNAPMRKKGPRPLLLPAAPRRTACAALVNAGSMSSLPRVAFRL